MVRKFLYAVSVFVVILIAGAFALRLWGYDLARTAFVPSAEFAEQDALAGNAYADTAMWLSHPRFTADSDPSRWRPDGAGPPPADAPEFAVFFVHPTSYLDRARWNAPLDDADARARARTFLRGMASPFAAASEIWAPRYRQATFGAFLTDKPEGQLAIDAAYRDVSQAFDYFLANIGADVPIVLAGHSQGARHIVQLLRDRAGSPLQRRIAMVYAIGWPISVEHDLPALGLPACDAPEQSGCVISWSSFAEPAEPDEWLEHYRASPGFDGQPRGKGRILCVNPVTGVRDGRSRASANLGTLKPNDGLRSGELVSGAVQARCDRRGLLLIGDPPQLGPYVLPGNNYHVYDIPLFWRNLEQDVVRRMKAWTRP